jgi:hypothetical protein
MAVGSVPYRSFHPAFTQMGNKTKYSSTLPIGHDSPLYDYFFSIKKYGGGGGGLGEAIP